MHSQFNLWKATIAVVLYVALCMLILCSSPLDETAAPSGDVGSAALVAPLSAGE